jgi:hypothetical protein
MDIFTHSQESSDGGRNIRDEIFSSFHPGQPLLSYSFCPPVDDHLVMIDICFIPGLTQPNIIKFSALPALSFLLKGFDLQEII